MGRSVMTGMILLALFTAGQWTTAAPGHPGAMAAVAGTATPIACDGAIREREGNATVMGTPASLPDGPPAGIADGTVAGPEVATAIQETLATLERCRAAGDVQGALTLFSDDAVRRLRSGTPDAPPVGDSAGATPVMIGDRIPVIPPVADENLRLLEDGRIGAVIAGDAIAVTGVAYVVFREDDGRWLIDEVGERRAATAEPEAPADSAAKPAVMAARAAAAATLGVDVDAVSVDGVEPRDWSDTALGCPEPETMYAEVITPGFSVRVTAGSQTIDVHTDATGERTAVC